MRINNVNIFISQGDFAKSGEFEIIIDELKDAIASVNWHDSTRFIINPIQRGNGVVPIKKNFITTLVSKGWNAERRMSFAAGMNPGPVDVIKETKFGSFAVEWETGNISSSHRALNKIAVGMIQKAIVGGILIIPIKNLAQYLTDRIGNYEEIEPYFPLYKSLNVESGIFGVISIDYDDISKDSPLIPKGKDGNAEK